MMKHIQYLPVSLLLLLAGCLVSCSETESEGEYANWRKRNIAYTDSIATVARTNTDGTWKVVKAWNKPDDKPSTGIGGTSIRDNQDYIYIHVEREGQGEVSACYTDSVSVSYRGSLINGEVFEETFISEELNPETAGRGTLFLNALVPGMTTAFQCMHEGDLWMVYMPSSLAYGEDKNGSIPAYSTLIFEMYLDKVNP